MTDGVDFSLDGFDEVLERLGAFTDPKSMRRITTRATRAGLKETRRKVRANAKRLDDPETSESIAKNVQIKINSKSFRRTGVITGRVGIEGGAKEGGEGGRGGDTFYWRFLEFGTSHAAAHPFIRPAMDPEEMTASFKTALAASIDKEIEKYGAPQ